MSEARQPWVTVITPSFNQGRFLGQTIDSVLSQDYPHLEYLVIDGGSSDETLDVLRSYSDRLSWVSEPDRGQSHAINKGLRRARGDIVAWLNADDLYVPGAVSKAVAALVARPDAGLVYGLGERIDAAGRVLGPFHGRETFQLWRLLYFLDFILQPATFFRRQVIADIGHLDEGLHWAMDWDLWIRLAERAEVVEVDEVLARAREHDETKTETGGWRRIRELGRVARRHSGTFWTPGVRLYALDTLQRAWAPRLPGAVRGAFERCIVRRFASLQRRLPVHADGWLGPRGAVVVPARWRAVRLELEALAVPTGGPFSVVLEAAGQRLASFEVGDVGRYRCDVELPPSDRPFTEILVRSGFSFHPDPATGDSRCLSLLCRRLEPGCS